MSRPREKPGGVGPFDSACSWIGSLTTAGDVGIEGRTTADGPFESQESRGDLTLQADAQGLRLLQGLFGEQERRDVDVAQAVSLVDLGPAALLKGDELVDDAIEVVLRAAQRGAPDRRWAAVRLPMVAARCSQRTAWVVSCPTVAPSAYAMPRK